MRKIDKIINITAIFMIIGVFLGQDLCYSFSTSFNLRPPLQCSKTFSVLKDRTKPRTAEEVFLKIKYDREDELSIARMIDQLDIPPEDIVLHVGPGRKAYHPVACAVRRAKVDIVQPDYLDEGDKQTKISQHDILAEKINDAREFSIETFEEDLIGDRINTEGYRGYIQNVNIPANRYSYVFLLNILDSIEVELAESYSGIFQRV